jgi:hypothetical protein
MEIYLKYTGDGSAMPGLPARNVTKNEVEASGFDLDVLLKSGLYEQADTVHAGHAARKEK